MIEERQNAIKELVQTRSVADQNQLVELLKKHYGIIANQGVVSRDLRRLGIIKKIVNGTFSYEMPNLDVNAEILKLALIDIEYNDAMIVIKTYPALADFVGDCIDQYDDLDILGCLSGENVVFVTPRTIKNISKVFEKLCARLHFKKGAKK